MTWIFVCLKQLKQALDIEFNICKRSYSDKNSLKMNLYMIIYKYQSVKYVILRENLD